MNIKLDENPPTTLVGILRDLGWRFCRRIRPEGARGSAEPLIVDTRTSALPEAILA